MVSKETKKFEIENTNYQFDSLSFSRCVKQYAENNSTRPTNTLELVANFVNVTLDATKQWYYGNNGPSELTIIKSRWVFANCRLYDSNEKGKGEWKNS